MTTTQQSDQGKEERSIAREVRNALIGKYVVHSLGSPADLLKVQVNPVGNDRYRVNVYVGKHINSARIVDSFFLTTDEEGNITTCSPKIVRLY